ncbi:peptidyl-prolyl cis-trans isomerase [Heyndrickxia sp. NPDC080065]|uniref:peptidyl-prolyl cis-trans isomerase n=1 Tax=Heyndrickxia sp. NPDC080065 TaxID=3390568 RepID=UPI003CFC75A9
MGKKQLIIIIVGLVLLNIITLTYFLIGDKKSSSSISETVATVGNTAISREDWLLDMEKQYGKEILQQLVDDKVVEQKAIKFGIKVSEKEIEQELLMIKTVSESNDQAIFENEDLLKRKIKSSILFEKIITKDVTVPMDKIKQYYRDNRQLYNIPTTYRISQIVAKSKNEAQKVIEELNSGSNFEALAMERSIDSSTSPQGGDLGYVSETNHSFPVNYMKTVGSLKIDEVSGPVEYKDHYAIIILKDKINGKSYSFDQVKDQIRRQIALESLETPITPESFWQEAKVKWFYGKDK